MQKEFTSALGTTVYHQLSGSSKASVFYLTGHGNVLDHHKGNLIESICSENSIGMVRFPFFGWDKSASPSVPQEGRGYTREWLAQALELFDAVTTGPQILIGYSMGGYLQLALADARPDRIHGIIGIAAGFGTNLPKEIQNHYGFHSLRCGGAQNGFDFTIENDNSLPIVQNLNITCPIRLRHATDDATVNPRNMKHIADRVASKDIVMNLVEEGGHRLNDTASEIWLANAIKELAL